MPPSVDEPGRRRRAYEVFSAALELTAAKREGYLERACSGDPALRREVDRLLAAARDLSASSDRRLAESAPHVLAGLEEELAGSPSKGFGQRIGPYRLVEVLGRGGMGVVWLAERDDGAFAMRVALKVVPAWEASDDLPRRLRAERQILAGLEHPNIARLLDGGMTEEGVPYLVMEHVEGEAIDAYCDQRNLGVGERIRLLLAVCDAVAAAHRRLVVHRDLKPSNVLVTGEGRVKLLDFGIAKLVGGEDGDGPTRTGLNPLTPGFAAPEQVAGGAITTATDVWGLGALLYRLLVGRPPCAPGRRSAQSLLQTLTTEELLAPSRAAEDPQRGRRLAGDLDAILMRALRLDPAERYPSAEALAADLRRHLGGLPVTARSPSFAYRTRKLVRRRPGAVAAGVMALVATVVVLLGSWQQVQVAERERARAAAVTEFFTGVLRQADPDEARGSEITLRQLLDASRSQLEGSLAGQPQLRAELLDVLGEAYLNLNLQQPSVTALEEALALRRQLHGNRHQETLESLLRLVTARSRRCSEEDVPSLESQLDEAQALATTLHGSRSAAVAQVTHQRGLVYGKCYPLADSRRAQGGLWIGQAVARLREHGDSPELANALHDLRGFVPADEVVPLTREALAMRQRLFGERDLRVARSLNDLGLSLESRGRSEEGRRLVERSLALHRDLLGERHPQTVNVTNNLAGILRDQGRFAQAEPLYRNVLEIRATHLPADHVDLSFSHYGLGRVLMEQGELRAAEGHLRRAYEILDGDASGLAGVAASVLGECLARQGRTEEAQPLLANGHRFVAARMGEGHVETALAAERLRRLGAREP